MHLITFLALGDSYTIGEGVSSDARWPVQLTTALRRHGMQIGVARIVACTGWTVGELLNALQSANVRGAYDLVSLQVGVNDQYRGYSLAPYRMEIRTLLDEAIELANGAAGKVMVISIPDWSVTPYAQGRDRQGVRREIESFNQVNQEEAYSAGAHYIDITLASRLAGEDASLLAADGLHPSAQMYALWVEIILPAALRILDAAPANGAKADEI